MEPTPETPEHAPDGPPHARHRRSPRGAWTIVAIFAVGLAVLGGLMLVPRNKPAAAPAGVPWGAAGEAVFLVTCDLSGQKVPVESVAAELRSRAKGGGTAGDVPDFLVVTHIGADEALALARLTGMQSSYRPQHHQRVRRSGGDGAGAGAEGPGIIGIALLSKHPLYEGGPLKIDRKRSAGVSAVAVVGGRKFRVACVYGGGQEGEGLVPLLEQRKVEGGPPTLLALAGEAGTRTRHREMLSGEFVAAEPGESEAGLSLLATREWRVTRAAETASGLVLHVAEGREPATQP